MKVIISLVSVFLIGSAYASPTEFDFDTPMENLPDSVSFRLNHEIPLKSGEVTLGTVNTRGPRTVDLRCILLVDSENTATRLAPTDGKEFRSEAMKKEYILGYDVFSFRLEDSEVFDELYCMSSAGQKPLAKDLVQAVSKYFDVNFSAKRPLPPVDTDLPVEDLPAGAVFNLKNELTVAAGADSAPIGSISYSKPGEPYIHTEFSCAMLVKHTSLDARRIIPSDSTAYRAGAIQAKVTTDEYAYNYHSTLYLPIEQSETFNGILCQYDYSHHDAGKFQIRIAELLRTVGGRGGQFEVIFPSAKKVAY